MSHYTVAVITTTEPDEALLTQVLQPFHEFECTGIKDQYVTSIDVTQEYRDSYEKDKMEAVYLNGKCIGSKYKKEFEKYWKRESPLGRSSQDTFEPPEGYEVKQTPIKEIYTFKQYLTDYEGLSLNGEYNELTEDGKVLSYTNPNKKWDWWVVGGRWSNSLVNQAGNTVDSCQISDLNFKAKIEELQKRANEHYDYFEKCLGTAEGNWISWDTVRGDDETFPTIQSKREFYKSQFALETIRKNDTEGKFFMFGLEVDDFLQDRETYVKQYSNTPFQCYNLLVQSEADTEHKGWHGGDMGWFGMGTQADNWETAYQDLLRSQPKDHWITVVDCHI